MISRRFSKKLAIKKMVKAGRPGSRWDIQSVNREKASADSQLF